MPPVVRVSIKYWKTSVRNTVFLVLDFIVHLSHYMFRPRLAAIFKWFTNTAVVHLTHFQSHCNHSHHITTLGVAVSFFISSLKSIFVS
jgi:hypothetical protein